MFKTLLCKQQNLWVIFEKNWKNVLKDQKENVQHGDIRTFQLLTWSEYPHKLLIRNTNLFNFLVLNFSNQYLYSKTCIVINFTIHVSFIQMWVCRHTRWPWSLTEMSKTPETSSKCIYSKQLYSWSTVSKSTTTQVDIGLFYKTKHWIHDHFE